MPTVFRTQQTTETPSVSSGESNVEKQIDTTVTKGVINDIEVPYSDYQKAHSHPYVVDYFNLGDHWEEVYTKEVDTIEKYMSNKIENGDIANSVSAIKKELKRLERENNLLSEERSVIKTGIIASYVRFLMDTDTVKHNVRKYGSS